MDSATKELVPSAICMCVLLLYLFSEERSNMLFYSKWTMPVLIVLVMLLCMKPVLVILLAMYIGLRIIIALLILGVRTVRSWSKRG